jgi:hypothetical protein
MIDKLYALNLEKIALVMPFTDSDLKYSIAFP